MFYPRSSQAGGRVFPWSDTSNLALPTISLEGLVMRVFHAASLTDIDRCASQGAHLLDGGAEIDRPPLMWPLSCGFAWKLSGQFWREMSSAVRTKK